MQWKHRGVVEAMLPTFLTPALRGRDKHQVQAALVPRGQKTFTHQIGGWVDPRAGQDVLEKKNRLSLPAIEPRIVQHID